MNLRDLEYVEAVGKYLSFSRAASACNVSQPALSNQIKKLEHELGAPLFDRLVHEVRPTELGLRVIQSAELILVHAQKIRDMAIEYHNPAILPLKIGMTPTLAPYLMQYLGSLLRSLFPAMRITLIEDKPDELAQMVEDRDLDIAIIPHNCHKTRLDFSPLFSEPRFLAVRTGHPLAQTASISVKDIPCDQFIRLKVPFGFDIEDRLECPPSHTNLGAGFDLASVRFETVCRHICNSDSCTLVPALAAEQFKRDNWNLSFISFQEEGSSRDIGIISRVGCPRKPLLATIGENIHQNPPAGIASIFAENSGSQKKAFSAA